MPLIRTEGLIKFHGERFRLGPIDLEMAAGQALGIVGPCGAGKTTLLRLIWGFLRPDKGTISVFDRQPHLDQVAVRLRAGYVAARPQFYDWMTARTHLEFVSRFYDGWDKQHADGLLERFGIEPNAPIRQLSRSERVELALIAAVGHNPRVLLMDEPVVGLDRAARRNIFDFLSDLVNNQGAALMLSSETSDDVSSIADDVLKLNGAHSSFYRAADHA